MTMPVLSHFVGWGPVWFWIRTWLLTAKGGSRLVCSDHLSAAFICRFLSTPSLTAKVSLVAARQDGDEVLDRSTKYALSRGELCVGVRGVAILKHGLL